jgi:hypothetical protein
MRHISLLSCGGGFCYFSEALFPPPPLDFADGKPGVYGKWISRRCLRRKLPFLPGPWQVFIKNLINEFGDELKKIIFTPLMKRLEYLKKPVKIDCKSLSNSSWAF